MVFFFFISLFGLWTDTGANAYIHALRWWCHYILLQYCSSTSSSSSSSNRHHCNACLPAYTTCHYYNMGCWRNLWHFFCVFVLFSCCLLFVFVILYVYHQRTLCTLWFSLNCRCVPPSGSNCRSANICRFFYTSFSWCIRYSWLMLLLLLLFFSPFLSFSLWILFTLKDTQKCELWKEEIYSHVFVFCRHIQQILIVVVIVSRYGLYQLTAKLFCICLSCV